MILVTTVIFIMALSLSNLAGYGRFELTNSSGRHLWQGVMPITDDALNSSPDYKAIMEFNPDRRRKNHWELRIPDVEKGKFGGEALLGRLAKEAILNKPLAYIKLGIRKFVLTIGKRPYRLGFGEEQWYDPLNTDELLPPIAMTILKLPTVFGDIVYKTFDYIYRAFKWIYPLVLFFVLSTYCAYFVSGVHLFLHSSDQNKKTFQVRYGTLVFFIMGTPIVALVSLGINSLVFAGVCLIILVLQSLLISKYQLNFKLIASLNGLNIGVFYTFTILLFFGSMWISWQVEIANTRNVLPYLPFIFITFGMSLDFWKNRLGVCRLLTR